MSLRPLDIPRLLHQFGIKPNKRLGQNFLQDESALRQITDAAHISPSDVVLEIGPGLGSLTRHLASEAAQVIAIELDQHLIPLLREVIAAYPNVRILQGDILQINLPELLPKPGYLVVANIPYYITSAVIRYLLELPAPPKRIVLTVQEEVAQRICAEPGEMSLLALSVQVFGNPSIVTRIPAEAFYPTPQVDSAAVLINLFPDPIIPLPILDVFFQLAKAGFSQKRKTLRNALAGGLHWSPQQTEDLLQTAGVDQMRRAETLSIAEWERVTHAYMQLAQNASTA